MRLNVANRSFFALVATALVPYGLLALFGCGVLSVALYRLAAEGPAGLHRDGQDLRPAVVFFAIVVAGAVGAVRSVRRQVQATGHLAEEVAARRLQVSPAAAQAAATARVTGRVDVVDDDQPYSFTYGLLRPRIAVSSGLIDAARADELVAVLEHERYHLRNADTVKAVVARAAPSAFVFLPALSHLRDRYLTGRELAADRAAVRSTSRHALAGALVKVLHEPASGDLHTAAALGGGVLEQRVAQLEDGTEPALPRVPPAARWLTVVGLAALTALFVVAVAVGGPAVVSMDNSMSGSMGGDALGVVGGAACSAAVLAVVGLGARGVRRRHPA